MKPSQINFLRTYLRQKQQGFTLIELLVASVVSISIIAAALGAISDQRKTYLGDRDRINTNNNLQMAMTLIGDDIKQAGELLEQQTDFPVISVVDGTPTNQPDSILIQRKLESLALTICQNVAGTTIEIADAGDNPACQSAASRPMNTTTGDIYLNAAALAISDPNQKTLGNLTAWRKDRCLENNTTTCDAPTGTCVQQGGSNSECLPAYIYDPVNRRGEFFLISGESEGFCSSDPAKFCWRVQKAGSTPWQFAYTPTTNKNTQPRLYILDQKEYRLCPDTSSSVAGARVLELIVNSTEDTSNCRAVNNPKPVRITNGLQDMQFQVNLAAVTDPANPMDVNDPNAPNAFNQNKVYNFNWQKISGIEMTLKGLNLSSVNTLTDSQLTLQSEYYPRNGLSVRPTN
jgi:prepilin-type N-terminal cleavage/methylation domain-containing protein